MHYYYTKYTSSNCYYLNRVLLHGELFKCSSLYVSLPIQRNDITSIYRWILKPSIDFVLDKF